MAMLPSSSLTILCFILSLGGIPVSSCITVLIIKIVVIINQFTGMRYFRIRKVN